MTKLLPQAKPVDCEACFLKTLHTSDQLTFKGKIFHGGTVRRGPTRGGSGGIFRLRTKGSSCDAGRRESRHQERDSGFVPIRAGGRLAGLYAEPTAAGAADSGGQRRTVAGSAD